MTEEQQPTLEQERLDKLISSESLDQLLQVVSSKSWLSLLCCLGIIVISLIWSFIGSIPVSVMGTGISMTSQGPYIVTSQTQGTINEVCVNVGQMVNDGDLIATISNAVLDLDIRARRDEVNAKIDDLSTFIKRIAEEDVARKTALKKEIDTNEFAMQTTESKLPFLRKDLQAKKRLLALGVVAPKDVEQANSSLSSAQIQIESYRATLEALNADYAKSYRVDEIEFKKQALLSSINDLNRLLLQSTYLHVFAERTGKILEIDVASGDRVVPGTEIASIEIPIKKGEHLHYYACFSAEYGDLLDVDLPVKIEVSGVDSKLYGYLLGKTKFVSPYPVTTADIQSDVRNAEIVTYLKGHNQLVYSAIIELTLDPKTQSGYKWTSAEGPPWELSSGTIGKIQTVVERKPPIVYFLPVEVAPSFYHTFYRQ